MPISGYHNLPFGAEYRSFPKIMARGCFRVIKSCLYIADNHNLAKVLAPLEFLETNRQQLSVFHKKLDIDESIVPYRGLHSTKQYIKVSPSSLAASYGCKITSKYIVAKMKAEQTLRNLCCRKKCNKPNLPKSACDFFLQFFTSHTLFTSLAGGNVGVWGAIRGNRTNQCPLILKKIAKNMGFLI